MKYTSKGFVFMGCFFMALSLCWCIYRDVQIEKEYPGDLRNRVVGSRMQMDGRSPYFYHWKPADGLRYYDWNNNTTTLKIANVTATPFFHQLLYPIANLPQRTISKIWLALEYLAVLIMTVLALRSAKEKRQQLAVVVTSLVFLYTYAWTTSIELGQLYIFIALAAMLFYWFITRKATPLHAVFAGVSAMSLILIRPNAVLFLLPFLLLAGRYTFKYKATLFFSFVLVFLLAFSSSTARLYWSDYRKAMGEHVKLHQALSPSVEHSMPIPVFEKWEGWEVKQIKKDQQFPYYKSNSENGNVFVFLNLGLDVKTPVWVLSVLAVSFMLLLCLLFYNRYRPPHQPAAASIALLGFCLYMASDIFSPVHRANYNAIQWIFPLLLTASAFSGSLKNIYAISILSGLLINSLSPSLFPMQHTIGEYIIYLSILGLLLIVKPDDKI